MPRGKTPNPDNSVLCLDPSDKKHMEALELLSQAGYHATIISVSGLVYPELQICQPEPGVSSRRYHGLEEIKKYIKSLPQPAS